MHLAFVEMRACLQDLVVRYGLMNTLDKGHFHPSIDTAVAAITAIDAANDRQTGEPEQT